MTAGTPSAESLYLIDAHALVFQVFHAIPPMTSPDGRPTNALFGFTRDLMYVYTELQPTYLICAFDLPVPTFRSGIAPDYKAHRPPPPDDLHVQIPWIQQVMEGMNIPVLAVPGFEADDIMATLAEQGNQRGLDVMLCTSDKDCRQLIRDRVKMLNLRKRTTLDRLGLLDDWGVTPEQVIDFQTLVGDKVDNITGVPGIGEKTAAKLLQQFGSVDAMIARIDEVPGAKVQKNLREAAANGVILKTRELVKLRTDVPLTGDWDSWRRREWNGPRLLELFQEFGFRSFGDKVRSTLRDSGASKNAKVLATAGIPAASQDESAGDDAFVESAGGAFEFAFGALAAPDTWNATYHCVDTAAAFDEFLVKLRQQNRFAFDLETTGLDPCTAKIVGYAFCWQAGEAYYLPVMAPLGETHLVAVDVLAALRPIFEDAAIAKVNQNIKFEHLLLRNHAVDLRGTVGDPMLAHYLLHAGERSHGLDEMTRLYLGHENTSIEKLIGKGKKQKTMDQVPIAQVVDYAGEDADAAWQLATRLETELVEQGLKELYDTVEVPLVAVLAEMETNGIRIDVPFLKTLSREMAIQLEEREVIIHRLAGREFNINSPLQLREVLFVEQKLPIQGRTKLKNEPSTDEEALRKLATFGHPLPVQIIEHRSISKLKGTYVDALPELIQPRTGRIHSSFNQTVTATGRLSSSDPNLQNIPTRTEMGQQIRQAFLPREGWLLVAVDYSQIELRMLAHFSKDEALSQAFIDDIDVHTAVASEIFGVPLRAVSSEQRRVAKTVNFGVIYGMSAFGLAERLGMPRDEAARFIESYFARYPKVLAYQDQLLAQCRSTGYVRTILGRRRRFDPMMIRPHSKFQQRSQAEREAINMEIQGSAADLMKLAMLGVQRRLVAEKLQGKMLLSVHDELVLEVPPAELSQTIESVRRAMIEAMPLRVPLQVDVQVGPNWLHVTDYPETA